MFVRKPRGYSGNSKGFAWPKSGTTEPSIVKDVFGPRPFAAHLPTVGYDYDLHRGIDEEQGLQTVRHSPVGGVVMRAHYTHFGWQTATQLSGQWTNKGGLTALWTTPGVVNLNYFSVGDQSFVPPGQLPRIVGREPFNPDRANDWVIEMDLRSVDEELSGNYKLGFGFVDDGGGGTTDRAFMEIDDTTIYYNLTSGGANTAGSLTRTGREGKTWLRIEQVSSEVRFLVSDDGATWETVNASTPGLVWAKQGPAYRVAGTFRALTGGAWSSPKFGPITWVDGNQSIGRFGNWVMISDGAARWAVMHLSELFVQTGDIVIAGTPIGLVGQTGYDEKSGRIIAPHVHLERLPGNPYTYSNEDPVNPLNPNYLPRTDVTSNATVVISEANDPDGVPSYRFNIKMDRLDQDFDLNEVFVAGSFADRSINFDTRVGLAEDVDVPKSDGLYLVPSDFDDLSAFYELDVYVWKDRVGSSFELTIRDAAGNTLFTDNYGMPVDPVLIDFAAEGTFSRASSASVFGGGLLRCFAANVLRPGVTLAYTLEGAATNAIVDPEALTSSNWTQTSVGSSTPDASASPEGTLTADQFAFNFSANARIAQGNPTLALTDSLPYTASHFHKLVSGSGDHRITLVGKDGGVSQASETPSDTWQRIVTTNSNVGVGTSQDARAGNLTATVRTVDLWGYQVEQSPYATSYICDGSGTRARDVLTVPLATMTALDNKRYYIEIIPAFDSGTGGLGYVFYATSGTNYLRLNNSLIQLYAGGTIRQMPVGTWSAGDVLRIELEPANGEYRWYRNGVWQATKYGDAWAASGTTFTFGMTNTGGGPIDGEISDIYEVPVADGDPLLDYTEADVVRASLAWNLDDRAASPGTYHEFASGEARVLGDGAVYVEGARTNVLDNFIPGKTGFPLISGTHTNDAVEGPNGELEASQLDMTASGDRYQSAGWTTSLVTLSAPVTFGAWLRGASGGELMELRYQRSDGTQSNNFLPALTTSWQYFEFTDANSAAGAGNQFLQIRNAAGATAQTIYSWGAMFEAAAFGSQVIESSGSSLTRAVDNISFSGVPAVMREGAWEFDWWSGFSSTNAYTNYIWYIDANNYCLNTGGSNFRLRVNGVNEVETPITYSSGQKITFRIDHVGEELTISGATTGNGTFAFATGGASWPSGTLLVTPATANATFGAISQPRRVIP